jgi:hypothetical protein
VVVVVHALNSTLLYKKPTIAAYVHNLPAIVAEYFADFTIAYTHDLAVSVLLLHCTDDVFM